VIVATPTDVDVIGTLTLVLLCAMLAVAGTEAMDGALELRFTTSPPAGAGADRFSVTFCVMAPEINTVDGEKLSEPATCTAWLPLAYPDADAVMVADPKLTPVTCG
jgi:hypothetical protein